MQLNVTYNGVSQDVEVPLDFEANDGDVRRIAAELLRSGSIPGLQADVDDEVFRDYVVDRFQTPEGGDRVFLRPKVPFGRDSAAEAVSSTPLFAVEGERCAFCGGPHEGEYAIHRDGLGKGPEVPL